MTGVKLRELASLSSVQSCRDAGEVVVTGVRHDSRDVQPGDLFVAIGGRVFDGADYSGAAIDKGAVAVAAEGRLDIPVPQLRVSDAEVALSELAARVYDNPTRTVPVVGVTGTNGKTTVAYLIEQMLRACGRLPAVFGTVGIRGPGGERPATHTTPMADELMRLSKWAVESGATELVMEVSSHGLDMRRVEHVDFDVAAFTNLTQDHLDFHQTIERYGASKARLFTELSPRVSVVNIDDALGQSIANAAAGTVIRYSCESDSTAELTVGDVQLSRSGIVATVRFSGNETRLTSPLLGGHNLANLLCVVGVGLALGYGLEELVAGLRDAVGAPGRLQKLAHPQDVAVFVDYAHTPDALSNVCKALRGLTQGRLIVLFGCGGDRDRAKRSMMGAAVAQLADVALLTSDNPRTEDPNQILRDIVPGMVGLDSLPADQEAFADGARGYAVLADRAAAIELAIGVASPGDTVLIAGKGHEDYQDLGTRKVPFSDVQVAQAAIGKLS